MTAVAPTLLDIQASPRTETRDYVYLHCKPDGCPFYVGKGSGRRAYRVANKNRNRFHQGMVKRYGADKIGVHIFGCDSPESAFQLERKLIAALRAKGYRLSNFNDGGEGSANPSPATRAKMAAAKLGRPMAPEIRAKIAATLRGKPKTPEHVAKVSASLTGRAQSPEAAANNAAARRGIKQTEDHVAKKAAANRGKKRSAEFCARMSAIAAAREAKRREGATA
jgi:hypothetical protein